MKSLLITAISAAISAGKEIMNIYESDDFEVKLKSDDSPLTIADKAANDIIVSYLLETEIPIISEENKQLPFNVRSSWDQCWIVDPLDGTKEFIKRNGEFTVNIALIEKGKPRLGVIYIPAQQKVYFTGEKSYKSFSLVLSKLDQNPDYILDNAVQIRPSSDPNVLRVVGSRSHLNEDTKSFIDNLKTSKTIQVVSSGSSLKFCLVAEGKADIYPRFAPTMEWDTAAGQAICEAAGVSVINQETGKSLRYNREDLLNPYFLVNNNLQVI